MTNHPNRNALFHTTHYEWLTKWAKQEIESVAHCSGNDGTLMQTTVRESIENLAEELEKENPKFDRAKFLRDCGLEGK